MTTDPGDLVLDPTCGSGTTGSRFANSGAAAGSQSTPPESGLGARPRTRHGRALPVLPPRRSVQRVSARKRRSPARPRPRRARVAMSGRGSSTNAFRTSPSSPSPTTPRSTSSGSAGRRRWSRCARDLERETRLRLGGVADSPRGVATTGRRRRPRRIGFGGKVASRSRMEIDDSIAAKADYEYLLRQAVR